MHVTYDLESYPNLLLAGFSPVDAPDNVGYIFELSDRRNDAAELFRFITACTRMIGFNNMYYDWPMLDHFLHLLSERRHVTAADMYAFNQRIFSMQENDKHLGLVIWKPAIEQVDLFMLHHLLRFGGSLKKCQFAMRSPSIQDLPYPPGTWLTHEEMDVTARYNAHDVRKTKQMFHMSKASIDFRATLGSEWLSYNDGKVGKKFFEKQLIEAGVQLYDGARRPIQTERPDGVRLGDVILPWIMFTRPENQVILENIKAELAIAKKRGGEMHRPDGSRIQHRMVLNGFVIDIKLGGIHGSVERRCVKADGSFVIVDADVTSYYPSIAIENDIFPAHLGMEFCRIYRRLRDQRIALDKKDPVRQVLKFALNVPFGSSNDEHSIFFDPAYMLAITMNGQLMLCVLAEQFANAGVEIIQVNTDGITIRYHESHTALVTDIYKWWQKYTRMNLEFNGYSRMFIRDANNYLAEGMDGKRKRVGAYGFGDWQADGSYFWQQDQSQAVVARGAEAAMLDDQDPVDFLLNHPDPWDFLILKKAPAGSRLQLADGTPLPKHTRFYISRTGHQLQKIMPPLVGKEKERRIRIAAQGQAHAIAIPGAKVRPAGYRCSSCGDEFKTKYAFEDHNGIEHAWKITPCNDFDGRMPDDIDFRYYAQEILKLIIDETPVGVA